MRTYELQLNDVVAQQLILFLKKFRSEDYNIFEISKKKLPIAIYDKHIEVVDADEQKEIVEELKDTDSNIIAFSETIEL